MGIKNLITLLSFLFVLFSCEKEEFEPEINQRTTFMYFPWSEDLIDYFYNNISDMEYAIKETSLKNERVIVFLSTSSIKAQMFEIILKNGNCIHSIFYSTYHIDFLISLSIFLTIYNFVYHSMMKLLIKGWQGFR